MILFFRTLWFFSFELVKFLFWALFRLCTSWPTQIRLTYSLLEDSTVSSSPTGKLFQGTGAARSKRPAWTRRLKRWTLCWDWWRQTQSRCNFGSCLPEFRFSAGHVSFHFADRSGVEIRMVPVKFQESEDAISRTKWKERKKERKKASGNFQIIRIS